MAYATHWRGEFTDNEGEDWKIEIQEDGYGGSVDTMQMSGNPLTIEWPSTSDDLHEQNIRGSQAQIEVYSESDMEYATLFTSDKLEYKVNIYYDDTTLYWTGFVTADTWREPYADYPYRTVISATDGLGLLKDFDFTDLSLDGRQTAAKVIHDILELISVDEFTEYINLYSTIMASTTSDSVLDQVKLFCPIWADSSCYDVLEDILKLFNAGIKQELGKFIIYRYKELDDSTMYGRTFTSPTAKSGTTKTPLQYIDRSGQSSNYTDAGDGTLTIIPQVKQLNITQDLKQQPSVFLNSDFDYNDFDGSDFPNWTRATATTIGDLQDVTSQYENGVVLKTGQDSITATARVDTITLTGTSGTADITCSGVDATATFNSDLTTTASDFVTAFASEYSSEGVTVTSSGADLIFTATTAGVDFTGDTTITNATGNLDGSVAATTANHTVVKLTQYVSGYKGSAVNTAKNTHFSIEYTAYNSDASNARTGTNYIRIWVDGAAANRYLQAAGTWTATPTTLSQSIASTAAETWNEWATWSINATEPPIDGDLYIEIIGTVSANKDMYGMYRNLTFTLDSASTVENIYYKVTNAVNGRIIDLEYSLGDPTWCLNWLYYQGGSIQRYDSLVTSAWEVAEGSSRFWRTRGGSEDDPIVELIGGEIGNQFSRPKHLLDIMIYERNNAFLNTIGRIEDTLNQYSGANRMFVIYQATYDVRMRRWNLSLNELI